MKAVIGTGGKQYIVKEGEVIEIERVGVPAGKKIEFKEVFALGEEGNMKYGSPVLKGAKVKGEVLEEIKGDKKISFKYRKKTDSHWKKGHRQIFTRVKITSIIDAGEKEK